MKGNNTLLLNEATMILAVQRYFDSITLSDYCFKVESVKYKTDESYCAVFEVKVVGAEAQMEERFMKKLMCKSFYYEFRDAKNKIVTADNKAALEAQVNVGNSGEPIVLKVGEMINAIEFVQDDNWKEWWFEFGWKILAECVVYVASPVNWIRYEAQGMMQNNPKSVAITNDGQGAASAELKDVKWMMDKMLMDRIDPLIEASHEWLCDHKGSFPGYNCKRCHCDDDGNGVSWQRKSPWVHGVYDKKKKGHCCD